MVIDADPANAPLGKAIGLRRQRLEVGPVELFEQRPAGDTEPPIGRSSLSGRNNSPIVVLSSAKLEKRRWRRRPSNHRSMISTATSTFALSRGRAGRIAVS